MEQMLHLTACVRAEGVIGGELLDKPGGILLVIVVPAQAHCRLGQPDHQVFVVPLRLSDRRWERTFPPGAAVVPCSSWGTGKASCCCPLLRCRWTQDRLGIEKRMFFGRQLRILGTAQKNGFKPTLGAVQWNSLCQKTFSWLFCLFSLWYWTGWTRINSAQHEDFFMRFLVGYWKKVA